MSKFWNFIKNAATDATPESFELRIEGDIVSDDDSWIYEWYGMSATSPNAFKEELQQCKGDINVWIDSYGGDVFAAAGIYNALKEYNQGNVTVKIDGKAMSAASVIAMAGDEILMSPVAIMMIHNPLSAVRGYASDMRKQAEVLDEVKESLINAYQAKTNMSRNKIAAMMDDETYMNANIAVKQGFANGILYGNGEEGTKNIMNISFDRLAIQNSAELAVKRYFDFENTIKIKNDNSCDCSNCNHSDNCQSSGAKCCICSNCSLVSQCSKVGADGCNCSECTMAQNNCCQPNEDGCMCSECNNENCMKGHGEGMQSANTMNSKNKKELLKAKMALELEL